MFYRFGLEQCQLDFLPTTIIFYLNYYFYSNPTLVKLTVIVADEAFIKQCCKKGQMIVLSSKFFSLFNVHMYDLYIYLLDMAIGLVRIPDIKKPKEYKSCFHMSI